MARARDVDVDQRLDVIGRSGPDDDATGFGHVASIVAPADEKSVRLVADVGGRVVGSARIELRHPSPASMLRPVLAAWVDVAVLEGQRGNGIGSRLMQAAERWARERGAGLMMLDASVANLDALRFYEHRHGYRRSGVLMRKPIHPAG